MFAFHLRFLHDLYTMSLQYYNFRAKYASIQSLGDQHLDKPTAGDYRLENFPDMGTTVGTACVCVDSAFAVRALILKSNTTPHVSKGDATTTWLPHAIGGIFFYDLRRYAVRQFKSGVIPDRARPGLPERALVGTYSLPSADDMFDILGFSYSSSYCLDEADKAVISKPPG